MTNPTFTLAEAKKAGAYEPGIHRVHERLVAAGHDPETARFSIGDIAYCHLGSALWCLRLAQPRAATGAIMPSVVRASQHTTDPRVHDCIAALQRWLAGDDAVDLEAAALRAWAAMEAATSREVWAVARATWAAAQAASETERATEAAVRAEEVARPPRAAERALQTADLIAAFPPVLQWAALAGTA